MATTRQAMSSEKATGIAMETVFGTAVAPAEWIGAKVGIIDTQQAGEEDMAINSIDPTHVSVGAKKVEGDVEARVSPGRTDAIAQLHDYLSGDPIHLNSATVQEIITAEKAIEHTGCTLRSSRFRAEMPSGGNDKGLIATLSLTGQDSDPTKTPGTPNFASLPGSYKWAQLAHLIDGADPIAGLRSVEIGFEHELDGEELTTDAGGTYLIVNDLPVDKRRIKINLGTNYKDEVLEAAERAQTDIALSFIWTNEVAVTNFGFSFPRCRVLSGAIPAQGDSGRIQTNPQILVLKPADMSSIGTLTYDTTEIAL